MSPEAPVLLHRGGQEDPYLLRGLVWCDLCAESMVTVQMPTGERRYACLSHDCSRPFVPAEELETQVWEHFGAINQYVAERIAPDKRQAALRTALCCVGIGDDLDELYYEWQGVSPHGSM